LPMPLPPLYGHEGTRNRLAGAIASGRLPQGLLIEGPRGVGKQRLALWLGQALLCERNRGRGQQEACGDCRPCRLVLTLSHPDLHWFVPVELERRAADADKHWARYWPPAASDPCTSHRPGWRTMASPRCGCS